MIKKKTEKAKQKEIEESVGGGAEKLDKVKGIRVFILCFVIKKKKKKSFDSILASILPFIVWLLLPLCKLID